MIPKELLLLFSIGVQLQVYSEKIDFDSIFHSPKRNYDDMEILERSHFEPDDPKIDSKISTCNKDEPKAIANAQVLLNFPNRADVSNLHKGKQNLPVIESRSFDEPRSINQDHPKCYYPFPLYYPGPVPQNGPTIYPKEFCHHYPWFYGAYYPPLINPTTCQKQIDYPTTYPTYFATSTPEEMLTTPIAYNPCKVYENLLDIVEEMSKHLLRQTTNSNINFDNEERKNIAEALHIIVKYLNAKCNRYNTGLQDPNHQKPRELTMEVSLILEDILSMLPITLLQIRNGKLILLDQLNCLLDLVKYVRKTFSHHSGLCEIYKDIKDMFGPCIFLKDPSSNIYQSKANIRGYLLMDSLNLALYLAHKNQIGDSKEDIIDLWVDYLYKTQFLDCHETYSDNTFPDLRKMEQLLVKLRKLFLREYALGLKAKNPLVEGLDNLLEFCNTKPVTFPPMANELDCPCKEKKHQDVLYELEKHNKLDLDELLSLVENYLKRKYNLSINKEDNLSTTTNPELCTLEPIYQHYNHLKQDNAEESSSTTSVPINLGQIEPVCRKDHETKPINFGPVTPICFGPGNTEPPYHEDGTVIIGQVEPGYTIQPINFGPISPLGPCTDENSVKPIRPTKPGDDHTEPIESINFGPIAPLEPCTDKNPPNVGSVSPVKPTPHPESIDDHVEPFEAINFGPIATLQPCTDRNHRKIDSISPDESTHASKPINDHSEPYEPINFGPIATLEPCTGRYPPNVDLVSPDKPIHPPKLIGDHTERINFGPIATLEPCTGRNPPNVDLIGPDKSTHPSKPGDDHTEPFEPINFGPIGTLKPCIDKNPPEVGPISPVKSTPPPETIDDHMEQFEPINFGPIVTLKPCTHRNPSKVNPVQPIYSPEPIDDYEELFEPINFGPIRTLKPCTDKSPPKQEGEYTKPIESINFGPVVPLNPCTDENPLSIGPISPPKQEDEYTKPIESINFGPIATLEPCTDKNPSKHEDEYTKPTESINFGPVAPLKPCTDENSLGVEPISPDESTQPSKPVDDHKEPFEPINFGPIATLKPCTDKNPPKQEDEYPKPIEPINFGPIAPLKPCTDGNPISVEPISPMKSTNPPKATEDHTELIQPINFGPIATLEPCTDENPPKVDRVSPIKPTYPPQTEEDRRELFEPINFGSISPLKPCANEIPPKFEPVTVGPSETINPKDGEKFVDEEVTDTPRNYFNEGHEEDMILIKKPAPIDNKIDNVSACDMDFWPDHCDLKPVVKKPAPIDEQIVNVSPCEMDFWPDHCDLKPVVKKPAPVDDQIVNLSPCDMDFWPDHCNLSSTVKKSAPVDESRIIDVNPCKDEPLNCCTEEVLTKNPTATEEIIPIATKPAKIDDGEPIDMKLCNVNSSEKKCRKEKLNPEKTDQHAVDVCEPNLIEPIEVIPIKLPSNQPIQLLCPDYLKHILSGTNQFILVPKITPGSKESKSPCEIPANLLYGGIPNTGYNILKSPEPIPCLDCCNPGCGKTRADLDGLNPKMSSLKGCQACGNCKICPNGRRCPYCAPYVGELNF